VAITTSRNIAGAPPRSEPRPALARSRILVALVAVILLGVAVRSLFKQLQGPSLFMGKRYALVGRIVAGETARLLDKTGQIVVVGFDYRGKPEQVVTETDAFLQEIKKQGITVAGTELQDPVALKQGEKMLPGDTYLALLQKYPSVDAIVSFVGPPQLSDAQMAELGPKVPKCVAVSLYSFAGRRLFHDRIIQVAVLPRFQPLGPNVPEPKSDQEWFDQNFQVVHVEDASKLPE